MDYAHPLKMCCHNNLAINPRWYFDNPKSWEICFVVHDLPCLFICLFFVYRMLIFWPPAPVICNSTPPLRSYLHKNYAPISTETNQNRRPEKRLLRNHSFSAVHFIDVHIYCSPSVSFTVLVGRVNQLIRYFMIRPRHIFNSKKQRIVSQ